MRPADVKRIQDAGGDLVITDWDTQTVHKAVTDMMVRYKYVLHEIGLQDFSDEDFKDITSALNDLGYDHVLVTVRGTTIVDILCAITSDAQSYEWSPWTVVVGAHGQRVMGFKTLMDATMFKMRL
jgi:hypothetical protein